MLTIIISQTLNCLIQVILIQITLTAPENIGESIDHVCRLIERENPDLDGVLTNTKYNDKRKYPDDKLRKLIAHFNSPRLRK
jgi:hypothetical protein